MFCIKQLNITVARQYESEMNISVKIIALNENTNRIIQ